MTSSKGCCLTTYLADPLEKVDGTWQPMQLYVLKGNTEDGKLPKYYCFRGTNKTENYFNGLHHRCLPGGNNSPGHAQQQMALFNLRWNIRMSIKYCGMADYKTTAMTACLKLNKVAATVNRPLPYPDVKELPETEELFGIDYAEHRLVKGELLLTMLLRCNHIKLIKLIKTVAFHLRKLQLLVLPQWSITKQASCASQLTNQERNIVGAAHVVHNSKPVT